MHRNLDYIVGPNNDQRGIWGTVGKLNVLCMC